jgi:predicted transcriptional regulator
MADDRIGPLAREVATCRLSDDLAAVRERIGDTAGCAVVNDERVVLGWLDADKLTSEGVSTVEEAMRSGPSTFRPNVPLMEMRDYMAQRNMQSALVTSSDGRLIGEVTLSDIEQAIHEADHGARKKRYV